MIDTGSKVTTPKSRTKKAAPVRRITLSPEALKAYEDLVNRRDERERTYERHLATDRR
jgi:hypothetical protein